MSEINTNGILMVEEPTESVKVTPITARNRADYEAKIATALKAEYKEGDIVDVAAFGTKYGVRPSNVKKVVEDLVSKKEYALSLPVKATTDPVVGRGR